MAMKQLDPDLVPAKPKVSRSLAPRMPGLKRSSVQKDLPDLATLIAFDPGGTTGWSLFCVDPAGLSTLPEHRKFKVLANVTKWEHGQVDCGSVRGNLGTSNHDGISTDGENSGINELVGLVRAWPGAAIVIEDFILDPARFNTGRDLLSPVRITSALGYLLWLQNREYFVQTAALGKHTVGIEQLRRWGYYTSTGGQNHARDADRHALAFLQRCANQNTAGRDLRESAWPHLFGPDGNYHDPGRRKNERG